MFFVFCIFYDFSTMFGVRRPRGGSFEEGAENYLKKLRPGKILWGIFWAIFATETVLEGFCWCSFLSLFSVSLLGGLR